MHVRPATNSITLRHIVLILLALVGLAERAARCPAPARLDLMPILRRAEYAAVALFIDTGEEFSADALRNATLPAGDDAPEGGLIRLAFSLRAMAAMLAATILSAVPETAHHAPFKPGGATPHPAPPALPFLVRYDTS